MTVAMGGTRRPAVLLPAAAGSGVLGIIGVGALIAGVSSDRSTAAKVGIVIVGLLVAAGGLLGSHGLATGRRRGVTASLAVDSREAYSWKAPGRARLGR